MSATSYGQLQPTTVVAGGGPPNGATATSISVSDVRSVALDAAGNVYIAAPSQNRVYAITASGTVSVFAGTGAPGYSGDYGAATSAQLNSPNSVAVDSSGTNIYIADTYNNRIRKVSGGVITTVAGNGVWGYLGDGGAAVAAQLFYPQGVAVDAAGNVYVADTYNHRIREITGGIISTVAGTGQSSYSGDGGLAVSAQLSYPKGVATDSTGSVYVADTYNHRIRKIAGGIISTVAGSGLLGYWGDGSAAVSAQLYYPEGVAADGAGNVYIADTDNCRIRKITGGIISTVAGIGSYGYWGDGGLAASAALYFPQGVAVTSAGSIYIADSHNQRVRKVTGGIITTVAGNGTANYSGDGGLAVNAQLAPTGIAIDSAGSLLIADTTDYRIRKVTANGAITTIAGNGTAGYWGDGGAAASALIGWTTGVASDLLGNLYLAETNNSRIRKVTGGVITTVAGTGTAGYAGDGGMAANAQLGNPRGVVADSSGNLYIADTGNNRIRKVSGGVITLVAGGGPLDGTAATSVSMCPNGAAVDSSGNVYVASPVDHRVYKITPGGAISTVAGNGTQGYSGDGGAAASAQLNQPNGVAVDGSGNVYIADTQNGRIRKVTGGVITTVAGSYGQGYLGDGGLALNALLGLPWGIAVDSTGANLYIGDMSYSVVRKVTGGIITTVAGNGAQGYSGDGGFATAAQISRPIGLALDSSGNLYIADYDNNRIRKVAGGIITTVAGTGGYGFAGDGGAATNAALFSPQGIAFDSAGSMYIADGNNNRIRKITGGIITTVAGMGWTGFAGDGGAATSARIGYPGGVAVDSAGNLYIADSQNYRVRKVSGGIISTVAGNGFSACSGDGGAATNAQLYSPIGLALDSTGNLYFSDSGNSRVRMISTAGTITTVAGSGSANYSGDGGPATNAALYNPRGVAVSGGKIYIVDQGNNRLRVVSGGIIDTVATVQGSPYTLDTLDASVAVDSSGRVYVSNPSAGTVSLVTSSGGVALGVALSHSGNFTQGQANATYTLTVSNIGATATSGTVTVTDTLPAGLTLVSMAGTGWSCTGSTCTTTNVLSTGASYPAITVTVNVAANAASQVTNQATVAGGGAGASVSAYDVTTVTISTPPHAVSVTPSSGNGNSQTFSFVYSDAAGASDLASAYASVNNGVTACMVQVDLVHGSLYLLSDAMTGWAGPITIGTATTLQNNQCTLNAGGSSAVIAGTQLTLNLALAFKPAFVGAKNVFGFTQTAGGLNSGWVSLGTWVVPGTAPPQAVSVTPSSGSGASQTFSFVYSDPYGGSDLTVVYAAINDGVLACTVQADLVHGTLYLDGSGPITMGTAATLDKYLCGLNAAGSGILVSGNQVTLNLAVTFKPAFAGPKSLWGYAQSAGGLTSGWTSLSTWTVPPNIPQAVSVTPSSGSGLSQTFSFVFSDPYTISDLTAAYAAVNNGVVTCLVQADLPRGWLYLFNDTQTAWLGPIAMGTATTLQNSQCTVNAATTATSVSGRQLTWNLALTFKAAFAGPKTVMGFVQNTVFVTSGWTTLGTWTVPGSGQTPQVVSVSPSSGSGTSQTFNVVYSDAAGAADMPVGYLSINDGVKACMVQVDLAHGKLYLLNDSQTGWMGPINLGTAAVLQNGQCTANGIGSGVLMSGNQATLNLNLAFAQTFAGPKSVYGYVQSAGGLNSGWVSLGTWTVAATPPQAVSVSPSSGSGSSRMFSFVYLDPTGSLGLSAGYASINDGVKACMVYADLTHGWLYLLNDAMTAWSAPIGIGSASTLQNSQCTLSGTGSGEYLSGNQVTLNLNLAFKPAFAGPKNVFGYAQNVLGVSSGWIALGTWTAQ